MATRANVLVKSTNLHEPQILLYHHFDGYPSFMLPTMLRYKKILKKELKRLGGGQEWAKSCLRNPAILASLIVATDPSGFAIEAVFGKGQEVILNRDIDYCYVITINSDRDEIFIEIYTTHALSEEDADQFWRTGNLKLLKQIISPTLFIEKEVKKILG
jgi:hypothetical protein